MFSKDDRGRDLFANSTIDTSNPDKIIIREKSAPKKKVRKRVKKDNNQLLSEKSKKTGKVKVTNSKKKVDNGVKPAAVSSKSRFDGLDSERPVLESKGKDKYTLPRLSEIQKKQDDYSNNDISSRFRESSANWKDKKYPDYSGLENLSESTSKNFINGIKSVSIMQWIALALAIVIFVSSILTTNVYAKRVCVESRQDAMRELVTYEDNMFEQVAEAVETVEEPISLEEAKPQLGKAVTLVLSSVEKDLKIKLVDEDETLVRGISWSVNIANTDGDSSDQADDDKDGIIHLTDISAGDYSVTLNPSDELADYELPASSSQVSVKAKVEYKVIQDIKEEIKSEKEVNAALEDAAGNQAAEAEAEPVVSQDTVEWVESTKTANGESYVEAAVDLSKTASIKKDSPAMAAADKVADKAKANVGFGALGYPIFLDPEPDPATPATHDHTYNWTSDNSGKHTGTCTVDGCSDTKTEDCDTSGEGGKCSKCGYKAAPAATHSHTFKYTSTNDGKHTVACTADGCSGGFETTESCDTTGEGGKCSKCGYSKPAEAEASISLNSTSLTLTVGETTTLTATPSPSATVTFASSDASVASVDASGKITALKAGTATITASANGKNATCAVTVKAATQTTIALLGNTSIKVGDTTTITISISPTTVTPKDATISDSSVASVSRNGTTVTVKGLKAGSATLKVTTSDGKEGQITITVTAQQQYSDDAQLYDANKNALYVKEGETYRLAKYKDYRTNSSQKFYRKESAYKYTGWQTIDGKTYYFNKDNVAVTGDQTIGGVKYHFGTDGALSKGNGTLGIDVSKYQPSINWSSVKSSGIDYVIIRCGYRGSSTGVLVEDPYFKSHIKGAKAAGLKVGIYFFTTAVTEAEAVEEASMVAYLCSGYGIDYPVFMDCESSGRAGYNGMSASQRTAIIKAFCNTIKSAGYTPGVYANKTWLSSYMNASELSGYKIWLAQYNSAGPTYTGRYDLWQYTSKGSVNGISGYVDMNQSYLGY